jgi:predicted GIY-YIG superfamily endonuclease
MHWRGASIIGVICSIAFQCDGMNSMNVYKSVRFGFIRGSVHTIRRRSPFRAIVDNARVSLSSMPMAHDEEDVLLCGIDPLENSILRGNSSRLEALLEEIQMINGGHSINCNSPRQVAAAIFGTSNLESSSTNQQYLRKVARGDIDVVDERGRKLAALVLQYRQLHRLGGKTVGDNIKVMKEQQLNECLEPMNDVVGSPSMIQPPQLVELNGSSEQSLLLQKKEEDSKVLDGTPTVQRRHDAESNSYQSLVNRIFQNPKCQIHDYWKGALLQLSRPSAQMLVLQLDPDQCPMGYDPLAVPTDSPYRTSTLSLDGSAPSTQAGKKGSFLAFCREQKEKYSDCVILTRCGDFYETFGVDAILLVEHCGLNAMGSKAKAGCPVRNVQATLDCLTQAGFRVAVYEEGADTDASTGGGSTAGAKSRIKSRFLAQIVSSAAPTYLYDLLLLDQASDLLSAGPLSRPYIGILSSRSGYTLTEVSVEERTVRVSERLTPEAVACRLAASPPADPLLYVPSAKEYESGSSSMTPLSLPFLPSRRDIHNCGPGGRIRTKILPPSLVLQQDASGSEVERAKKIIVSALLELTECRQEDDAASSRSIAMVDDFTIVSEESASHNGTQTKALYLETATQLGLMDDGAIPSMVSYLVPDSAPAATRRFLRRWLLTPPPPAVSGALSILVTRLMRDDGPALPPLSVPPLGKVLAMIRVGQASAQVYAELLHTLHSTILILDLFTRDQGSDAEESASVEALMTLLEYESGMAADPASLRSRCHDAIAVIEAVLCPVFHVSSRSRSLGMPTTDDSGVSECSPLVPRAFLERNEAIWRGRVRRNAAPGAYEKVQRSAERLARAVDLDFSSSEGIKISVVQDVFNNIICLKEKPSSHAREDTKYKHPKDRFGKTLGNRYTTEAVESALSDYVAACDKAAADVSKALVALSASLHDNGHIPAIVQASHANLVLATAFYHAVKATSLGWSMAETVEPKADVDCAGHFQSVWPYWMDRSEAVKNTFDLGGMWILTAPNMSGKSTIMRSTAAAALLTMCGLCAPLQPGSRIRRFDHIFVRGASSDIPTEQKSAFGAEMADVAALFRCCTNKSLVFVDELGRGTSPRDGTRLSGAVLEAMATEGMSGIFATHLHDIFKLPLQSENRLVQKRMAIHEQSFDGEEYTWTYRLEDGVCTDSLALITAKKFGIPVNILKRAKDLSAFLPSSDDPKVAEKGTMVRHSYPECNPTPNISSLLETTSGQRVVEVAPGWSIPAAYNGKSAVYILKLHTNPTRYYIGESDNIRTRIERHRSKGESYRNAVAFICVAPLGKSQARMWENRLIRKLASSGILLDSIADGRTIRAMNYENFVDD